MASRWALLPSAHPALAVLLVALVSTTGSAGAEVTTSAGAQVTTAITPSGLNTVVTPPAAGGTEHVITGGTRPGNGPNLFHSFGSFSVGPSDTAKFVNTTPSPAPTNILSRVTGGTASSIFGTITVDPATFGAANLFLLNGAGIIVGSGAKLNVAGAVHFSTAGAAGFRDTKENRFFFFSADSNSDTASNSVLTIENPSAVLNTESPISFRFLSSTPASISIQSGVLQGAAGQTLSLVGGNVTIGGGATAPTVSAPGGRVQVVSVGSDGEVVPSGPGAAPDLDVSSFTRLGRVDIAGKAVVHADGTLTNPRGTVIIRGGQIFVDDATVRSNTPGSALTPSTGIDVTGTESITLKTRASVTTTTSGLGRAPDVRLRTPVLSLSGGASVALRTGTATTELTAPGRGGSLRVEVDRLAMTGGSSLLTQSRSFVPASTPGTMTIEAAQSISMSGSQTMILHQTGSANAPGSAPGADADVKISTPSLVMDDRAAITARSLLSGAGGRIIAEVGDLSVKGGARITTTSTNGTAGSIHVKASGSVTLSGGPINNESGIVSESTLARAGRVSLDVGRLEVTEGALVRSGTIGGALLSQGDTVTILAREAVTISNRGLVTSQAARTDVSPLSISSPTVTMDNGFIVTSTVERGTAGDGDLKVSTLTMTRGAKILSSTGPQTAGNGGVLRITAGESVTISGFGTGLPSIFGVTDPSSGLFSTTGLASRGSAGEIIVTTPTLNLGPGGKISVETRGSGPAGSITLNANEVNITGARIDSSTSSSGAGGNVTIQGGQVDLTQGAAVSARSSGPPSATAGSLLINATRVFRSRNSTVTTEATQADGGDIDIRAGSMVHLVESKVTTSVQSGVGKGGNISIDPEFVILDRSEIRADAFGGPGGNINLVANIFLTNDSVVSASSALSTPGTINVQAQITDVSGSLVQLPENVLQAATLLRASCAARLAAGKASSLVVSGREGLPVEPTGPLPSLLLAGGLGDATASWSQGPHWEGFPRLTRLTSDSKCSR